MAAGESARAKAQELLEQVRQLERAAQNWQAGAVGEERVAAVLEGLDKQTTRVLHDRLLNPSSKTNIDHIVVCPSGIYLIDAKNWTGNVSIFDGSLWQHWTGADGRKTANKNAEVSGVRAAAVEVQLQIGRPVTPVLCLANENAGSFGEPRQVGPDVHVVPLPALLSWIERRPSPREPIDVATVAVDLSCQFAPAVGGGGIAGPMTDWIVVQGNRAGARSRPRPPRATRTPARSRPGSRRRTSQRGGTAVRRALVGIVGLIALATIGPRVITAIATAATHSLRSSTSSPADQESTTVSPAAQQRLDDWRIRAGLYKANAQPATLPYVQDANLGSQSGSCRAQESKLAPFRRDLLHAPDPQLAAAAKRYDAATRQILAACAANNPVSLHHAEGAISAAASDVNVRYNRLLGHDPTAYTATKVL